jgi:predicted ATPase/DNA-binding CsgD family transcriptional regulator
VGSLPAELTSFVGRRQELLDLRTLLATGRLVTLAGPGGVGKTRLALRLAVQVRRTFPDGVWLVELAGLQEPALLARTVASALGLRDGDGDSAARLAGYLGDRSLLLLLDNCEHLAVECAALVRQLLPAAPGIRVLATSRHVLGVEGEHVYSVPTLLSDAVGLFADRAAAVSTGFTVDQENGPVVAEICRRLDGLPLAIELAAAWLRVLSVNELLERLDGLSSSSLEAAMTWSYDLCTPAERALWTRLSVFAGFDLPAVEAVGGGLEALAGLVDKSIVQREQGSGSARFRLLEPLRQYGLSLLDDEDGVRTLHRDHYLRLAEWRSEDWRRSTAQVEAQLWARVEHANLRAALEYSMRSPAVGLRFVVALHFDWLFCGHPAEGKLWLERALELNPEPSRRRAVALGILSYALSLMGEAATIYAYAAEADSWAREHEDADMLAHTVFVLGAYYFLTGEIEKATPLFHESIRRLDALDHPSSFLLQLHSATAQAEIWQGRPTEGMALARRALERCDDAGEQYARGGLLYACALAQWMQGSYAEAASGLTEAIRLAHVFNDVLGAATWLELLCWTTAAMGRAERAAELLGVAHQVWPMGGGQRFLGSLRMSDAHDVCEREVTDALGNDRYQAAFGRGAAAAAAGFDEAMTFVAGRAAAVPRAAAAVGRTGSLSDREYQVAGLVAQGLTNKEIALRLVISRRTAESHVVHILDKLGFSSRSQIAAWLANRMDR